MKTETFRLTTVAQKVCDGSTQGYISSNSASFLFSIADTLNNAKGWHISSTFKIEKGMAIWVKTYNPSDINVVYVSTYTSDEVSISVNKIEFEEKEVSATVGNTVQVKANVYPENANDKGILYTTSMPEVATVNSEGLVSTVSSGKATITARSSDGGFTDNCIVTVSQN